MDYRAKKAALFVAHPGHILRVYRWIEIAKPLVFVITDGSVPGATSRLPATTALLEKTGARPASSLYGQWTDMQVYDAILNGDAAPFAEATRRMADELVAEGIEYIAGDASEGHQCTHEMCRFMLNTALVLSAKNTGRAILNYEFLLFGPPNICPAEVRDRSIRIDLDEPALERKLAAAYSYNPDFMHEVEKQIAQFGREPFMVEYLLPAGADSEWHAGRGKPRYETNGEELVLSGKYQHVIRHSEHFEPLVARMRSSLGVG